MRRTAPSLAAFACAVWLIGCGGYGTYCQDQMDCLGGNEQDVEACEVSMEADEEIADVKGCADVFEEYFACHEEKDSCNDMDQWTADTGCDKENEKLTRCLE